MYIIQSHIMCISGYIYRNVHNTTQIITYSHYTIIINSLPLLKKTIDNNIQSIFNSLVFKD